MTIAEHIRTLVAYNRWANQRVLSAAEQLEPAALAEPAGLSHGSILGALAHVFAAEQVWRLRCEQGVSPAALPSAEDFPELQLLRSEWDAESQALTEFVEPLDEAALQADVAYRTTSGAAQRTQLWQVLVHVVNHGTQFRAEAAVALSQQGASPGDLDFIAFVRQQPRGG